MKSAQYWQTQEQRWYDMVQQSEKTIEELESALHAIEMIALKHIDDVEVRASIKKLVDSVWRFKRP